MGFEHSLKYITIKANKSNYEEAIAPILLITYHHLQHPSANESDKTKVKNAPEILSWWDMAEYEGNESFNKCLNVEDKNFISCSTVIHTIYIPIFSCCAY